METHVLADFVNRSFLFATFSQKINESHVVGSPITLLIWPCFSLTEKQHTINDVIIFNDPKKQDVETMLNLPYPYKSLSTK